MKLTTLSWLVGLLGFVLAVLGIALWSVPAALVAGGVALVGYAYLLDRAAAAQAAALRSKPPED